MPHFSATGHDVVLCQVCGRRVDTGQEKVVWRPDITGSNSAGNVCPTCLEAAETDKPKAGFWTVAIYLIDKAYGGPEEGGWWYTYGNRVDQVIPEAGSYGVPATFGSEQFANEFCQEANIRLDETVNKERRSISSVLSKGKYRAQVYEGWPPASFPEVRPHYE